MTCALCGRTKEVKSNYLRTVRKQGKHLVAGYFQPRLSEIELFALPNGESEVCTNRRMCKKGQITKEKL